MQFEQGTVFEHLTFRLVQAAQASRVRGLFMSQITKRCKMFDITRQTRHKGHSVDPNLGRGYTRLYAEAAIRANCLIINAAHLPGSGDNPGFVPMRRTNERRRDYTNSGMGASTMDPFCRYLWPDARCPQRSTDNVLEASAISKQGGTMAVNPGTPFSLVSLMVRLWFHNPCGFK